jgi:16S rRNA (adenine(1408)-N(1))-methyltransferase
VVTAAEALPRALDGTVSALSIYFPWGSLLKGLVAPSPAVLEGIARILWPGGTLTALLSITARDGGEPLGPASIDSAALARHGLVVSGWRPATANEVIASDSSWAKRLAAGAHRPAWLLAADRRSDAT